MYDVLEVLFKQFYLKHTIMTVVLSKCVLRICSKLVFVLCCVDGQLFVSMATRLSKKGNGCFKVSQCVCMQGSVFMVYYLLQCVCMQGSVFMVCYLLQCVCMQGSVFMVYYLLQCVCMQGLTVCMYAR